MTEHPNLDDKTPSPDIGGCPAGAAQPAEPERRSRHRVGDDQKTGQGSQSALSKLKMIERKRAAMRLRPHED